MKTFLQTVYAKLKNLTPGERMKLVAFILALSDLPLTYSQTVMAIPHLPGWITMLWPVVLIVASVVHKAASIFFPNVTDPTPVAAALPPASPEAGRYLTRGFGDNGPAPAGLAGKLPPAAPRAMSDGTSRRPVVPNPGESYADAAARQSVGTPFNRE